MDGFAVLSADIPDGGAELKVAGPVPAGAEPPALERGFAVPIMTGAMLPEGADAVVPIEQAVPSVFPAAGAEDAVVRLPATSPRTFVRDAGSDIAEGALALSAGTCLGPAQLGLLAALGLTSVQVRRPLRVLLVTTGDEVIEPGQPLVAGKIYDSNGTLLEASMRQAGLEVLRSGISNDDPAALADVLREHTVPDRENAVDLIVTTGGVSKGAYEVVRQAMAGEEVDFLPVAMQPGGPQGIGTFNGVPFLGFPGNPVSCLVSFEMFLRPALSEVFGAPAPRPVHAARLAEPLSSPKGKQQVRRGVVADGVVRLEGGAGSHLVHALARSNVLIQVPADVTELQAGAEVEVWVL
jgi:molybdopterin molybdotransferase